METTRTFMIACKEIKKDEQKFIASTAKINGMWYKIKFTKECETAPRKKGLYDLTVDLKDVSIQKGKKYTNKKGEEKIENDTLWISKTKNLRKYTDEELEKRNIEALSKVFYINDDINDDDAPF